MGMAFNHRQHCTATPRSVGAPINRAIHRVAEDAAEPSDDDLQPQTESEEEESVMRQPVQTKVLRA